MGISFPTVTKCCFCIPLRIASLLIGYFSIIASCMTLSAISFYIFKVTEFVNNNNQNGNNTDHTPEERASIALYLYLSFAYYLVVFLYNLVIHLLLVIGVHRNKPQYLKLYVNTAYFLFALAIALIVVTCIFLGFLATIPVLKWAFTLFFCIVVVRSTLLEMEEQNKPKIYEMQNLYMPPHQAPLMT